MEDHEVAQSPDQMGFWDQLGLDDTGMPVHLPISHKENCEGPTKDAHHWECWCSDPDCLLAEALGYAWMAGRRSAQIVPERLRAHPTHANTMIGRQTRG